MQTKHDRIDTSNYRDLPYIIFNNEIEVPFITGITAIDFVFNIFGSRHSKYAGSVNMYSIDNIDGLCPPAKNITSISFRGKKTNIRIEIPFTSITDERDDSVNMFKGYRLRVDDLYAVYKDWMYFITEELSAPRHLYTCFNTSYNCNMNCPYCFLSQDLTQGVKFPRSNTTAARHFIEKGLVLAKETVPVDSINMRVMGGETFLDMQEFRDVAHFGVTTLRKIFPAIHPQLIIYSNFTVNIDKYCDWLDEMCRDNVFKKHMPIISCDTLNPDTSDKLKTQRIMDIFKANVELFGRRTKDNPYIRASINMLEVDGENKLEEVKELAEFMLANNITMFATNSDESIMNREFNYHKNAVVGTNHEAFLHSLGMRPLKKDFLHTIVTYFRVFAYDHEVFCLKYMTEGDGEYVWTYHGGRERLSAKLGK